MRIHFLVEASQSKCNFIIDLKVASYPGENNSKLQLHTAELTKQESLS
jgi:hypothetical protein